MPPLSIMIKPASADCNLQCDYCFYRELAEGRETTSTSRMSTKTALSVIESAFSYAKNSSISFTFQGGEPLLIGAAFFETFFADCAKLLPTNTKVSFSVQTNGTLLNDRFCKLFHRYNVLVGLSLDGTESANCHRVDKTGINSFTSILHGANLLKKHNVAFNILSVVTKEVALNITDIYNFFKSQDFRYLQFIPCLPPLLNALSEPQLHEKSVSEKFIEEKIAAHTTLGQLKNASKHSQNFAPTNDEFLYFLKTLFSLYETDFFSGNYVSERRFDNYINLLTRGFVEQCGLNGVCSEQFVIEADGAVYPCDFYCTDQWLLGNINNDDFFMLKNALQKDFLARKNPINEACSHCEHFFLCRGGGCKRASLVNYCDVYHAFFNFATPKLQKIADLLKKKQL